MSARLASKKLLTVLKNDLSSDINEKRSTENRIYLSIEYFKGTNSVQPLDLVIVKPESKELKEFYGIAWPSLSLSNEIIEINSIWAENFGITSNQLVYIQKYIQRPTTCSKIFYTFMDSREEDVSSTVDALIKQKLRELKFVHKNMKITIFTENARKVTVCLSEVGPQNVTGVEDELSELLNNSARISEGHDSDFSKHVLKIFQVDSLTEINRKVVTTAGEPPTGNQPNFVPTESSVDAKEKIGGLNEQLNEVLEMLQLPMKNPELFKKFNLQIPKGILLYGPPGTGKTLLAQTVAQTLGCSFYLINGPDIIGQYYGETEEKIREIFTVAQTNAPSIIFVDEIDSICPKREESQSGVDRRIVATFLTLLDGIDSKNTDKAVFILAATNRPNSIDSALRRPGRFDKEIEIGIPNTLQRYQIFSKMIRNIPNDLEEKDIMDIVEKAHGYVGADLALLVREASLMSLKSKKEVLKKSDFLHAMSMIKPSAMREITIEVPKVHWTDIGGQSFTKQQLQESVEWPLKFPEAFTRMGISPPKGVLLYGPPGCSKTMMAKALATEAKLNFISVKGPELFNKWVGESEKAIREIFRKARAASPSIIFFDEIDAIAGKRSANSGSESNSLSDRVLSTLLNEMDGVEQLINVTVVAATNRPDYLDEALLRPGRFDRLIYVSPPDLEARIQILEIQKKKMPFESTLNISSIAEQTENYTGAELVSLCQEAAMICLEENIENTEIKQSHFKLAFERVKPRLSPDVIQFYQNYQQNRIK